MGWGDVQNFLEGRPLGKLSLCRLRRWDDDIEICVRELIMSI
jgi:hypothetical protein